MKLHSIRGGNISDFENKKYNIGIGISLGNKWFTLENIIEAINWVLPYTRKKLVVYVADSIHAINLEVRNRISHEKALKSVLKAGTDLFENIKNKLISLPPEQLEKIVYVKWDDLVDHSFKEKVSYLNSLYSDNENFKEAIHSLVKNHTSKETRNFSDADIHRFGQYIIEEMPEFLSRVPMKGVVVDAYAYPLDNDITKFAEQIQKGEIFPEIKARIIDTEPKVFLEVR